jgi:hypothetical protein
MNKIKIKKKKSNRKRKKKRYWSNSFVPAGGSELISEFCSVFYPSL